MAEIRRVQRSNPLSSFSQARPQGGTAWAVIADLGQTASDWLAPIAEKKLTDEFAAENAERAAQNGSLLDTTAVPAITAPGPMPSGVSGEGAFPASLIRTESGGNWSALNDEEGAGGRGHGGRLQFGTARLQDAARHGIIAAMSPQEFARQPPEVQQAVEAWHFRDIDRQAEGFGLGRFIDTVVGGVRITQNAIRAMAHLGGIEGARRFLESGGRHNPADSFGTSLLDYARTHGESRDIGPAGGPVDQAPVAPEARAARRSELEAELPGEDTLLDALRHMDPPPDVLAAFETTMEVEDILASGEHPVTGEKLSTEMISQQTARLAEAQAIAFDFLEARMEGGAPADPDTPLPRRQEERAEELLRGWVAPPGRDIGPAGGPPPGPAPLRNTALSGPAGGPPDQSFAAAPSLTPQARPDRPLPAAAPSPQMSAPPAAAPSQPAAVIRDASGRLKPLQYHPLSSGMFARANAAGMAAFLAETTNQGLADVHGLAQQFRGNPEGFQEAARNYVDEVVRSAPAAMRADLRLQLGQETRRSHLGLVDDQRKETEARANNASSALVERFSQSYADAIASGDAEALASARGQLEDVLYARESLPGINWTREQSDNILSRAIREGERQRKRARTQEAREWQGALQTVIQARENGMVSENEGMVSDPAVREALPELVAEAEAVISFQEAVPTFMAQTPEVQAQIVQEMRETPVGEGYEIGIVNAAARLAAQSADAWEKDPITQAGVALEASPIGPPPPMPTMDVADPQAFIAGLAERRAYGDRLLEEGYVDQPAYLTRGEADALSTMLAPELPPEARLLVASSLATAFGERTGALFDQLDVDGTLAYGATLLGRGGQMSVASDALRGQVLIDEGMVSVPAAHGRRIASVQSAFEGTPLGETAMAGVMDFAKGLYAVGAAGQELEGEESDALMEQSIQRALGQREERGRIFGGVQEVGGHPVWLPMDAQGEKADGALRNMAAALPSVLVTRELLDGMRNVPERDAWRTVGPQDSLPYLGDTVLTRERITSGEVRLVPTGGANGMLYRMEVARSGTVLDVTTDTGATFYLDLNRLTGAP